MLLCHEKNALCDSYIVEFSHDATENYYERGTYAFTYLNNIKFPLYVLKVLKLCLFCLPMLVDSCSHKLFSHKIPMHRKWVRLKCASHVLHDALFVFQFISFMRASLKSSCLAKKALKKSTCWETTQHFYLLFLSVHMIMLLYWSCLIAFFNKFPSKAFGIMLGDSWFDLAEKQELLRSLPEI